MKECKEVVSLIKQVWRELSDATLADEHEEVLKANLNLCKKRKKEPSIDCGFSASNPQTAILRMATLQR